jgi:hypothetical protein
MTSEYEAYELKLTTLKVSFLERDNAPKVARQIRARTKAG